METSLREDFDAMHSVLVLFLEQARALEAEAGRFLRTGDPADADIKTFESLLQSGKPRCGQVRDAQRDYLFGKDSVEIGSVALTPLGPKGELGILAIGASDAERFHPGHEHGISVAHRRARDLRADALSARSERSSWKRRERGWIERFLSHLAHERRMSATRWPPIGTISRAGRIRRAAQVARWDGFDHSADAGLCRRPARRRH